MKPSPPWAADAWSHWHQPWLLAHAARPDTGPLVGRAVADDWVLRLHYPAWCEQHGLETQLQGFEDNTWWRLLGVDTPRFDESARRVGLTLMFAADARTRLLRGTDDDAGLKRWAIGRTPLVPEAVSDALRTALGRAHASAPNTYAAQSLQWCLAGAPGLWSRLRLRFAPADLPGASNRRGRETDPSVCTWLSTLWASSVHTSLKEKLS